MQTNTSLKAALSMQTLKHNNYRFRIIQKLILMNKRHNFNIIVTAV